MKRRYSLLGGLNSSETKLISLVDTLAHTLHPFELTLTTVDHRSSFYQSLFVHVQETKQLMELRKMAVRFFDGSSDENYMPHLSLLYGDLSTKEKGRMLNNIGREFYKNMEIKSLVLMKTSGEPNQWLKIHTAVFKSKQ
ncbi:MAG TPA: 2'-5' RNA ligase family protein [Balneolaceae bacterium]